MKSKKRVKDDKKMRKRIKVREKGVKKEEKVNERVKDDKKRRKSKGRSKRL